MANAAPKADPLAPFEMAEVRKFALNAAIQIASLPPTTTTTTTASVLLAAEKLTVWITTGVK